MHSYLLSFLFILILWIGTTFALFQVMGTLELTIACGSIQVYVYCIASHYYRVSSGSIIPIIPSLSYKTPYFWEWPYISYLTCLFINFDTYITMWSGKCVINFLAFNSRFPVNFKTLDPDVFIFTDVFPKLWLRLIS